MSTTAGRTERLAAALIARHDFIAAVKVLNHVGILPMPLKGVLLQQLAYRDPADRILSDADLLVPARRFDDAVSALGRAHYRVMTRARTGTAMRGPGSMVEIDLHRRLFSPGLFSLRSRDLFARGRIDERAFTGAVVVIPDVVDIYAHLIGNFAKGRHIAEDTAQLRDFSVLASRYGLTAAPIAAHLRRHGLARAARYALGHAADQGDPFAAKVLRALPLDPLGRVTSQAARKLTARFGSSAPLSAIAPHLVNRSLPQGAASAMVHAVLGIKGRIERRRGRA